MARVPSGVRRPCTPGVERRAQLLEVAATAGEIAAGTDAYQLMRGVGNLCLGAGNPRDDPRRMVELVIAGS